MADRAPVIHSLRSILDDDPDLTSRLEQSLKLAHERAEAELDSALFDALQWPTTLDDYEEYLEWFLRWIPQQSTAEAWASGPPGERNAQEVSDRLAHFFWLVDQNSGDDDEAIVEGFDSFGRWLTEFASTWGDFLDTPESFDDDILRSFIEDSPEYRVEDSMVNGRPNMPSGWHTFNQFFARQLNTGLRPISDPTSNLTVTSPADASFVHRYDIDDESNIPATTIKGTHKYGNIGQLLEGSNYADAFAGGTFVHYMLPPSAYHRFHLPVSGRIEESFVIHGKVYLQVELEDGQLQSLDSAASGYEFRQTRGVVTLDTAASGQGDLGKVAVVSVGMAHVASVVLTTAVGTDAAKGDQFGYFQFGGSDIIVLLQKGVEADVDTSETFRLFGTPIARCSI